MLRTRWITDRLWAPLPTHGVHAPPPSVVPAGYPWSHRCRKIVTSDQQWPQHRKAQVMTIMSGASLQGTLILGDGNRRPHPTHPQPTRSAARDVTQTPAGTLRPDAGHPQRGSTAAALSVHAVNSEPARPGRAVSDRGSLLLRLAVGPNPNRRTDNCRLGARAARGVPAAPHGAFPSTSTAPSLRRSPHR